MKVIDCVAEWTWVFTEGLGCCYGLHKQGRDIKIRTLPAAEPFFYFLNPDQIEEVNPSKFLTNSTHSDQVYQKNFDPHKVWGECWSPPPIKNYYKKKSKIKIKDKPILVVNNKYNIEWSQKPYNFLSLDFLNEFFSYFIDFFDIYYIRYMGEARTSTQGYYDEVPSSEFNDYRLIADRHKEVNTIYDVMAQYGYGFNEAQLMIMSKSEHHVCSNGGTGVLSSYFGGDIFMHTNPECRAIKRGIWKTDSWLSCLSGANIIGHHDYDDMIEDCKQRWTY